MATRILIDSASDINQAEAQQLGITLLPIEVRLEGKDYLDGATLSTEEFYNKLESCVELPKTSQISPIRFQESFDEVVNNGDEAVVICLSSKLSGSYNNARMVSENYNDKIFVVDSLNACIGERVLCFYALELLKKGYNAAKIAKKLEENKTNIRVMAVINTLKYLRKGGRISALTAFAGEMMSIKPLIAVIEGEVKVIGKAMGYKKGTKLLTEMISKSNGIDTSLPHVFGYSGNDVSGINDFIQDSAESINIHKDTNDIYAIGCTIGTHVGPGAIAIAYFEK